jgi:hypothetical protein
MTLLILTGQPGFAALDNSAAAPTTAIVRQEIPPSPPPWPSGTIHVWPGDQTFINVAAPPQIQLRGLIGQEWPWHPAVAATGAIVWSGDQMHPNVAAPPQIQARVVGQEQPGHLPPQTWSGDQAHLAIAALPQVRQQTLAQEQPPPLSVPQLATGVQGPNVAAPPQVAATSVPREQPWHPDARFEIPGVQGPNVAPPPQIQQRWVGQEQPGHPGPLIWSGDQAHLVVASPPQIQQRTVGQEQPPPLPAPTLLPGVRSNTAPPPQIQSVAVAREQPAPTPVPQLIAGVQAVLPFIINRVIVQQLPDHPPPLVRVGPVGPNVAAPPQAHHPGAVALQEQPPPLPPARTWSSVQGPNVMTPVSEIVVIRQEQPPVLPMAQLWPGQSAYIVRTDFLGQVEWLSVARADPSIGLEDLATQRIDPAIAAELGLSVVADPPAAVETLMSRRLDNAPVEWAASFRADAAPVLEGGAAMHADALVASEVQSTARNDPDTRADAWAPIETAIQASMVAHSALPLGWRFNPFVFGRRRLRLLGRAQRSG